MKISGVSPRYTRGLVGRNELFVLRAIKASIPFAAFPGVSQGKKWGGGGLILENAEKYLPIKLKPFQMCIIIIVICCIAITWSDFSVLPH